MTHALLTTKLTMPKLNQVIHRQALVSQLQNASQYPLIVIQAAAGFGKTHLIYDWLSHSDQHICWLSLDEMNDVPSEFWQYLSASLDYLSPQISKEAHRLLENRYIDDVTPICDATLTALHTFTRSRNRPSQCVLVLDDFHHIKNHKILNTIARFIDHKPYWLQVVIASRTMPALKIPNRLSKKNAYLLTSAQLNYTEQECSEVLNASSCSIKTAADIHRIYTRSQGWPAAVQLLAMSSNPADLSTQSINAASNEYVSEFLMEEIYSNLSDDTQQLLSTACVLPRFNLQALQCISDEYISIDEFDALMTSGLTMQVDNTGPSQQPNIKIHELFRDWLEQKLTQSEPQRITKFRKKAMLWLMKQGHHDDTFSLAIKSHDWPMASLILGDMFEDQSKGGRFDYLQFLLHQIPQEHIEALPKLSLLKAILAFSQHKKTELNHYINCAQASIDALLNQHNHSLAEHGIHNQGELNIISSSILILKDLVALFDGRIDQMMSIKRDFEIDNDHPMQAWWYHLQFVHAFMNEDLVTAIDLGKHTLLLARSQKNIMCCISTASWLSHCLYQTGQSSLALTILLDIKHWLASIGALNLPNIFSLYASLGYLYIEKLDFKKAQEMYALVENSITEFSEPREVVFNQYHFKFKLLMSMQKIEDAGQCLQQIHDFEHQYKSREDAHQAYSAMPDTSILQCLYELKANNVYPIIQWAMQYEELPNHLPMKQHFEYFIKIIGLTLSGQDQTDELEDLILQARTSSNHARRLSLELFQCSLLHRQGEHQQATNLLLTILAEAKSLGYKQLILDGGPSIESLLNSLEPPTELKALTQALLASKQILSDAAHSGSDSNHDARPDLVTKRKHLDTLTNREAEVLAHLALGMRNQEIAHVLDISLATVKRHIQNIYSKLDINSRTEAALLFNHLPV